MDPALFLTVGVMVAVLAVLVLDRVPAELAFLGALIFLMASGVVSPAEALSGFSNSGVITIGMLFIVSAAIQNTGSLNSVMNGILGYRRSRKLPPLILRLMFPVAAVSAFINNTPIVVILVPIVKRWAEKLRVPASKFLIPLSYAAIFGGMCTLIGTSTNLVVHGLMLDAGLAGYSFFELAKIGVPFAVAGTLYTAFIGSRLLPGHKDTRAMFEENKKEYIVEMKVRPECELAGRTVQEAGLRNLRGLFLIDIEREGKSLGPVSRRETILAEDRLIFVGLTGAIVDLQEIPGLVPAADEMIERDFASMRTHLVEAVISANSPILDKTVKESQFRRKYGAGIIAVHRNGERIRSKIGSIQLKAGDTLLLLAPPEFLDSFRDSQDFLLVSSIKTKAPVAWQKASLTLGIVSAMILGAVFGPSWIRIGGEPLRILQCSSVAAVLLILTRSIRWMEARKAVRTDILLMIACALGISKALTNSGLAELLARSLIDLSSAFGPAGVLMAVYFATMILTEVMTNNAAAAFLFPVALAASHQLGVDPKPMLVAVTVAASSSFATPIGYQTNLIVQGAGGYRFADYLRVGGPLSLLLFLLGGLLIPLLWSF